MKAVEISRQMGKPVLMILAAVLALLILVVLVAQLFFNPLIEKIFRAQVEPFFGDRLRVGSVSVSLWRGALIIKNVDLAQPPGFGQGSLLRANNIRVRVALWPLLRKEILVYSIKVVKPEMNLVQAYDGRMNTTYYFNLLSKHQSGKDDKPFRFHLNRFLISNGQFSLTNPKISYQQPSFRLQGCNLEVKNINAPNIEHTSSPFHFNGLIASAHPARLKVDGSGTFGAGPLSFEAKSKIDGLELADFAYLFPDSKIIIKSGQASVVSEAKCTENYLDSTQKVHTVNLKVAGKKGSLMSKTFLGVPSAILVKFIQDKNGVLDFEFKVTGNLNQLKADLRGTIGRAVARSLRAKMGSVWPIARDIVKDGAKRTGNKIKQGFKKVFH